VGSFLGTLQLILYFIYRGNKGNAKTPTKEESMEMGTAKPMGEGELKGDTS